MLTGDNRGTAEDITNRTGIDKFKAEVLPKDKLDYIKELQQKGYKVAMVGDGINDSPALSQADIGIAMGHGTDIAIESSDITLVKGDLEKIAAALKLSKATVRTIKENLFWAFI
jgi:P-type E1-E2 ATPase